MPLYERRTGAWIEGPPSRVSALMVARGTCTGGVDSTGSPGEEISSRTASFPVLSLGSPPRRGSHRRTPPHLPHQAPRRTLRRCERWGNPFLDGQLHHNCST